MKLPDCDLEIACNELFQNEDVFKHFLRKEKIPDPVDQFS